MSSIFLTSLGTSWAVIPEILHWLDSRPCDFYQNHPDYSTLRDQAESYGLCPVDEVWVVTTSGTNLKQLREWLPRWQQQIVLQEFIFPAEDLSGSVELRRFRELVFRVCAKARERCHSGKLWISLAGGRKTMSADMQAAATFFGCDGLLHVLDRSTYKQEPLSSEAEDFLKSWPTEKISRILPVLIERSLRSNPLSPEIIGSEKWSTEDEALTPDTPLVDLIEEKLLESANLFANYHDELLDGAGSTNFLALYSLPKPVLQQLQEVRIGCSQDNLRIEQEISFLRALPKPDLHCHLGGVLNVAQMLQVAGVHQPEIEKNSRLQDWLNLYWRPLIRKKRWVELAQRLGDPKDRWKRLRQPPGINVREPLAICAFLLEFRNFPDELEQLIYGDLLAQETFVQVGIDAYERLGDLQGSGLLQSGQTITETTRILLQTALVNNVYYLEIRCSPLNYLRGGLSATAVVEAIEQACDEYPELTTKLVFIGSRHGDPLTLVEHINLAINLNQKEGSRLVGFDLAGNEERRRPAEIRQDFLPLLERCLQITIHAGETAPAESIWEAVYHLQADRIGHGLKLKDQPELLRRFVDRRIAVEMCPSSNYQIVGFQDSLSPTTKHLPTYPLKEYLQQGLKVCVNTDNPGISRTDFTRELHIAARLSPNGLGLWDIFQLLRNGFTAGFCKREDRQRILRTAEQEIMRLLQSKSLESLL